MGLRPVNSETEIHSGTRVLHLLLNWGQCGVVFIVCDVFEVDSLS